MITLKNISWSNWFSYGEDNHLSLNDGKVVQIVGKNGCGKSSIPVIIGEVLYGKNALGKTKQQLFNRYLDKPTITASIDFIKDNDEYKIDFSRKTTVKVALFKNGEDISSHSSTNTYKTIQDILGYDFKTFWGVIYQSSKEGLEFLTATDTNRKKFLINLFNLMQYMTIHEFFKKLASEKNTDLKVIDGKVNTIESWIEKHSKFDLTKQNLLEVPSLDKKMVDQLTNLKVELANIKETNKKINDNNQYKYLLNELNTDILSEIFEIPDKRPLQKQKREIDKRLIEINQETKLYDDRVKKLNSLGDKCDRCLQDVDQHTKEYMISQDEEYITSLTNEKNIINDKVKNINSELKTISNLESKEKEREKISKELQDLLTKVDKELPSKVIIEEDLLTEIDKLTAIINKIQENIKIVSAKNLQFEAHNSKVKVISEQLVDYNTQLAELQAELTSIKSIVSNLEIIKKAFSTNGLVSYKIENVSKELENQINIYLAELSKGRFQLQFTIVGDKLNIEIIDDGLSIGIEELSAGELARVNTATLLAIRKLMAAISTTKINILFLDEILGVLDDEGKEVLIDILNSESELNTFLVSHEYSHPLVSKLNIIKENKISRIEE
jgi:DNA repair exonuclease SbcCD ATPase subunit